jgi:hypothetical protein
MGTEKHSSSPLWPGLQCELAPDDARVLRATRLHLGPDRRHPALHTPAPELPGAELVAIFRVMADLLGDPAWPQLHPRPCTDTP